MNGAAGDFVPGFISKEEIANSASLQSSKNDSAEVPSAIRAGKSAFNSASGKLKVARIPK